MDAQWTGDKKYAQQMTPATMDRFTTVFLIPLHMDSTYTAPLQKGDAARIKKWPLSHHLIKIQFYGETYP